MSLAALCKSVGKLELQKEHPLLFCFCVHCSDGDVAIS